MLRSSLLSYFILLTTCFWLIVGCSSRKGVVTFEEQSTSAINSSELCYVELYRANNQVKIYVDGELVHDTTPINDNLTSESTVSLTDYLTPGKHKVKLELYNGEGLSTDSYDQKWQIHYEMFLDGEPIHFVNEKSVSGGTGLVWSITHEVAIN